MRQTHFALPRVWHTIAAIIALAVSVAGMHFAAHYSAASPTDPGTIKTVHIKTECQFFSGGKTTKWVSETWYDGPEKTKRGYFRLDGDFIRITTRDQDIQYQYNGKTRLALIRPATNMDRDSTARNFERLHFVRPADEKDLLSAYAARFNLAKALITGTKTVAGRMGDVVEGQFVWDDSERMVVIVDRETGESLTERLYKGNDLLRQAEVAVFEVNQPIPDKVFEPKFPAGTLVFKGAVNFQRLFEVLPRGFKDPSELEKELAMSPACDINFAVALEAVYRPAYVPPGYKLLVTGAENGPGPIEAWKTDFVNPATGDTITFHQKAFKPSPARRADDPTDGQLVQSGKFRGFATTSSNPYAYTVLRFFLEGPDPLAFTLTATSLEQDELVKIAKSVTPSESAATWLGKRHTWRVAAKVLGNPDADTVRRTAGVVRKRMEYLFGPWASVELSDSGSLAISASSNNRNMGELISAAVIMPGHLRLVEMPSGTKLETGHMAEAVTIKGPQGGALPESEILNYKGSVLDETDLVHKQYPFAEGGQWDQVEVCRASAAKASAYAKSHPGRVLAVVLDDRMVAGYVFRDFPHKVNVASQAERGRLFKAVLQSGLLPSPVEAEPAKEVSARP